MGEDVEEKGGGWGWGGVCFPHRVQVQAEMKVLCLCSTERWCLVKEYLNSCTLFVCILYCWRTQGFTLTNTGPLLFVKVGQLCFTDTAVEMWWGLRKWLTQKWTWHHRDAFLLPGQLAQFLGPWLGFFSANLYYISSEPEKVLSLSLHLSLFSPSYSSISCIDK